MCETLRAKLVNTMKLFLKDATSEPKAAAGNNQPSSTDVKSIEFADAWMAKLFDAYQEQKVADNKRIWEIGKIFVPISLGPFVIALDQTKRLGIPDLWICAGISVSLYFFWLLFAERHRNFQKTGERAQIKILQQMSGTLNTPLDRLTRLVLPESEEKHSWCRAITVQILRWIGLALLLLAWWVVIHQGPRLPVPPHSAEDRSQQSQEQRPKTDTLQKSDKSPVTKTEEVVK